MKKLLKTLYDYFLDLRIKRKILMIFFAVGILPFICYIAFSFRFMNGLMLERETSLTQISLEQAILSVDAQIDAYQNLSNTIFADTNILKAVSNRYGTDYFRMYKAYSDMITPSFQTFQALHPDLYAITIYSDSDIHPQQGYIAPLDQLKSLSWFPLIENRYIPCFVPVHTESEKKLYLARKLNSIGPYNYTNYLCMEIDYENIFSPFLNITNDAYEILITDSSEKIVFSTQDLTGNTADYKALADLVSERQNKDYMVLKSHLSVSDWDVYYYKDSAILNRYVTGITAALYAFAFTILVFLAIMMLLISISVIRPIETLTCKMQEVEKGNLHIQVTNGRKDEVGILFQSFSNMLTQINHFIQVTYKNELEKKDYQQKILYAQINPHFLYNSLSLINSKAIVNDQKEISQLALLISSFYRTALNRGNDMTTLDNELINITSYIEIQLLSYSETITVTYEIDDTLRCSIIPNFILQPLVENAIDHGLKASPSPDKALFISAQHNKLNNTLLIVIEDNGIGMSDDTVRNLFENQTSGYGIKNVHDRLKLLYGDRHSLVIKSVPAFKTTVHLEIPLDSLQYKRL